jgi:hypothetical protein
MTDYLSKRAGRASGEAARRACLVQGLTERKPTPRHFFLS